jgi:hypothetical protein
MFGPRRSIVRWASETAADRGMRDPELAGDQPRAPTGSLPGLADTIMDGLADPVRLMMRRRGAILRPRAAGPGQPRSRGDTGRSTSTTSIAA